jgi:hypothetical protein
MDEVVFAFSGAERGNQFADPAAEMWNGSLGGLRRSAFSLLKACSIGLRSGEYFGR